MSKHIELRANTWYANLIIPKDVRPILGKFKFLKSLETSNKKQACLRAAPLVALWKAQIDEARGDIGAVNSEALRWRGYLANAQGVEFDVLEENLLDKAKDILTDQGEVKAGEFYKVAMGYETPIDTLYSKWETQIDQVPKTKDQTIKDVKLFITRFSTIEKVTKQEAKRWVDELIEKGVTVGVVNRLLISARNYWKYLRQRDVVSVDNEPLKLSGFIPKSPKKNRNGWIPFEPSEVVSLWKDASLRGNKNLGYKKLADLIYVAMYTGARIEEIGSLEIKDITDYSIRVVDSKTIAGIREIPIHSKLEESIKRMIKESKDGYLISGLTINKFGDRSGSLGTRFGRLKTELGYGKLQVFHSIRKTFVTILENEGITENISADIVGHEKPNITYKLYSKGNSFKIKKAAVELVKYDFD